MNRWKVILAAALIFTTGAATGVFSFRAVVRARMPKHDAGLPPSMMDSRFDFLSKMKQDLGLDEGQSRRIDTILQEGRKRVRELWVAAEPPLREEMKGVRERIQAELTPAQREKFDELMKRSRERRMPKSPEGNRPAWKKDKDGNAPQGPQGPGSPGPMPPPHSPAPAQAPDAKPNP